MLNSLLYDVGSLFDSPAFHGEAFQYGDDYIDVLTTTDSQTDEYDINDFDFDLLELELDEMLAADAFEVDDDYENEDEEEYFDEAERIDAANIPPDILGDPVKLLEWLERR